MKTFAKNDFYFQLTIFVVISITVIIALLAGNEKIIWLFYFGIGISQLVSYLIRCSYNYKKSLIFKIYGYLILPIFPSLILLAIFGNIDTAAGVFIVIPIISFFYSPILAVLYLIDCHSFYKSQKQKP
ncbi:MAG: hypothetical protein DI622_08495 [Chryseobacterium sp.]|uniref:hypothetical protein n=1 Tax=unclassified Chryseobacterium TaxID=2593645 RepID=UPI000DB7DD10|nr:MULTISPECIES: hypothetical protein [unclassified Chryseobacterium]MPS66678.1 hypothetical protein [Chryseobacterium sp.]PZU19838.1 MAG: hypothetical protein DI622_08495 [Chryseobacterium sp.]UMQ43467.1 hypothetical protein MKS83_07140 [Chryseobacterium sp. Y16C]